MILLGIVEFGRAYNVQTTLTNAARESVRSMAINNSQTDRQNGSKKRSDSA
jgi:Flp pilus assembly protein TadG